MNKPKPDSQKTYAATFAALMLLLGATFWLAHVDLGRWSAATGLLIAVVKVGLVVLNFMHLRYSNGLIRVVACVGVFWLGILFMLSMTDYFSRNWLLLPSQWP